MKLLASGNLNWALNRKSLIVCNCGELLGDPLFGVGSEFFLEFEEECGRRMLLSGLKQKNTRMLSKIRKKPGIQCYP